MSGLQHHFVAGLRAQREVEYLVGSRRPQRLHLEQSENELCGPMALAQAVMLICGWPRAAVGNRATRWDPMRTFWQHAMAFESDGTSESDLSALAAVLAPAIEFQVAKTGSAARIASVVADAIDRGHVPLIRYTTQQFSHWCMIAGQEKTAAGTPLALLALDTDMAGPWAVMFNCRIELHADKRRAYPYPVRGTGGELWYARLDSVCVVRRGPGSRQ